MNKDPLYLLDGYSLIYRTYFAMMRSPMFNSKRKNVSVIFGFFRSLLAFFDQYDPKYFAVTLDSPGPTFRKEMFPEYKANREKAPDDLHDQIPVVMEILKAMQIPFLQMERFEADDIMATFAAECRNQERPCYLLTGDKDLLQLVDDYIKILKPDKGKYLELGRESVRDSWAVEPDQILDYLSLTGDSADNVPGVTGIGPKTAANMLGKFKTLDGIYENLDELTKSQKTKMEEGKENAYLSKKLITLEMNVPMEKDIESLKIDREKFNDAASIFQREEVFSIAEKLGGAAAGEEAPVEKKENPYSFDGEYYPLTDLDAVRQLFGHIRDKGIYAFDVETDSVDEMIAQPVGLCFSHRIGKGYYLPLSCPEGSGLDTPEFKAELKTLLEDPSLKLIGQNIKYDYKVMARWGIELKGIHFDTMVAAWLLDSNLPQLNMDFLAERYLDYKTLHFKDVVPKGETFDQVPLEKAVSYAAEDADITFRLYEVFKEQLEEEQLDQLFYKTEMPFVQLLADMELRGIDLDGQALAEFGVELGQELDQIKQAIYGECGKEFNINSTKQLQVVLFEDRKLKPIKKTKTGYSTDTSVLEELAREDIVPQLVLRHRTLSKLKSTYVDALPKEIHSETGRIHTRLVQTGTATGRLSSRDPNLQNIPIKTEEGRKIRSAFRAKEGHVLLSADYSQIELVLLAHLSEDPGLSSAFNMGEDVHALTASLIFNTGIPQVTADQRRIAKTINFGVMYGMSGFRLSRELSIPMKQANEFIKTYFERYKGIKGFIDQTVKQAEESSYVYTLLGHRRQIPGITSRNKTEKQAAERVAVNTPIQGSGADLVKLSMMKIDHELKAKGLKSRLILQIHDEVLLEVPEHEVEEVSELVRSTMEGIYELSVPLRVSLETGKFWGEFH